MQRGARALDDRDGARLLAEHLGVVALLVGQGQAPARRAVADAVVDALAQP